MRIAHLLPGPTTSSMRLSLLLPGLLLAGCVGPPPGDPPPAWCEAQGTLEAACTAPHCAAAVVVDYKRLEPRGFRIFSLSGAPVDQATAESLAVDQVTRIERAPAPDQIDSSEVGDFFSCFLRYYDGDSWLVLVHRPTGQVVFAGLEVWADAEHRGYDFPLPPGYADPSPLGCTTAVGEPESKKYITTGAPFGTAPASTPDEAWSVVRRLNLTEQFTAGGAYRVLVISYAPATGEFDTESADWYAWITPV